MTEEQGNQVITLLQDLLQAAGDQQVVLDQQQSLLSEGLQLGEGLLALVVVVACLFGLLAGYVIGRRQG